MSQCKIKTVLSALEIFQKDYIFVCVCLCINLATYFWKQKYISIAIALNHKTYCYSMIELNEYDK